MKHFFEKGMHFGLSAHAITGAPLTGTGPVIGTVCHEIAAIAGGQAAIELLLVGSKDSRAITHILTVRTAAGTEADCIRRHQAITDSLLTHLHKAGYLTEEMDFAGYAGLHSRLRQRPALWMLRKGSGMGRTPVQIHGEIDRDPIYTALEGQDNALCIQIVPYPPTMPVLQTLDRRIFSLQQLTDVDPHATLAIEGWKALREQAGSTLFSNVNLLAMGDAAPAALLATGLRQALGAGFQVFPLPEAALTTVHRQPWELLAMAADKPSVFEKYTLAEVEALAHLPIADGQHFVGIAPNACAALPEHDLLPLSLQADRGLFLGTAVHSGRKITLPYDDLLYHTNVFGKTGCRKTTLLKAWIQQLHSAGKNVLILEPIKREFRSCVYPLGGKIYTVEHHAAPLRINPFEVPDGLTLKEWKPVLYQIFKSTITMPDPLPSIFAKALTEVYRRHGWRDLSKTGDPGAQLFGMEAFIDTFKQLLSSSGYGAEVKANIKTGGAFRIESLLERAPDTLSALRSTPVEALLGGTVLVEMGHLQPEEKALVTALLLEHVLQTLKCSRKPGHVLRNVLIIDEAHALFDQHGVTQEEKELADRLRHLVLSMATEIRALGMAVVLSDQTPSRMGTQLVDNCENKICFQLTGMEAVRMKEHMGADDRLLPVLAGLQPGTFVFSSRHLPHPLLIRMDFDSRGEPEVTDADIAGRMKTDLPIQNTRPFTVCDAVCDACCDNCRRQASEIAGQIFKSRRDYLNTPGMVAEHIVKMPRVLAAKTGLTPADGLLHLSACTAIHLHHKVSTEMGITLGDDSLRLLLPDMQAKGQKKGE